MKNGKYKKWKVLKNEIRGKFGERDISLKVPFLGFVKVKLLLWKKLLLKIKQILMLSTPRTLSGLTNCNSYNTLIYI